MASGKSGAPSTHSSVAPLRYPERNRRGPLVINPLLPNRESRVSDLASRPARKDGEKTRFSPYHIVLRSLNTAAQRPAWPPHGSNKTRPQTAVYLSCLHSPCQLRVGDEPRAHLVYPLTAPS